MSAVTDLGVSDETLLIPVGPLHALIDASDRSLVESYTWHALCGHNGKIYAYSRRRVYMHRLIAGTPAGFETDHINGDGLDNRRANLRIASASQNSANMGKPARPGGSAHSSRYKGVSWDRSRDLWQAKITVNQHCRNLGRYSSQEAAALAYDEAARAAWGEFAMTNRDLAIGVTA